MKASGQHKFYGKQAMTLGIFIIIAGFIAAIAVANTVNAKETVVPATNYSDSQIEDKQIYEFKNAILFDEYAVSEYSGGKTKDHFYVVGKYDRRSAGWVLYSVCLNEKDELFAEFDKYVNNSELQVGDVEISFCARANNYLNEDQQIRGYYIVAANEFSKKAFDGEALIERNYNYTYIFDSADKLKGFNKRNGLIEGFTLAALFAVIALGIVIFYRNLRRIIRGDV